MAQPAAALPRRRWSRGDLFRYCRLLHGWLSAFAFVILCFFAFTGLLLNHPEWTSATPATIEKTLTLSPAERERIDTAEDPGQALAEIAGRKLTLKGAYSDGDLVGNEVFVRMQGVRGLTDLRAKLDSGELQVVIEPAPTFSIINELHRAERAGGAWRAFVDGIAVLIIVLSLLGYLIFLSLRFRLRTALLLSAASVIGIWGLFVMAVA